MSPDNLLLAFGADSPVYIGGAAFFAGVALLYSREISVRIAGLLLCTAAMIMVGQTRTDVQWWIFVIVGLVLLAWFRPQWLRQLSVAWKTEGREQDATADRPHE